MDDEALFAFDSSLLADFDVARAHGTLKEHGETYRAQLVMALWLDGWRERMAGHDWDGEAAGEAFDYGAREIAAHLRQGDFLPGGVFHREIIERQER